MVNKKYLWTDSEIMEYLKQPITKDYRPFEARWIQIKDVQMALISVLLQKKDGKLQFKPEYNKIRKELGLLDYKQKYRSN